MRSRFFSERLHHLARTGQLLAAAGMLCAMCASCFTGIENTRKIELSREDRKAIAKTAEDTFLSNVRSLPLSEWMPGHPFLVADGKISLLFEPGADASELSTGRHLYFMAKDTKMRPDGSEERLIVFCDSLGRKTRFATGMSPLRADTAVISTRVPMLIDLDAVDSVSHRISGRDLWAKTPLRYSPDGEKLPACKFDRLRVRSVQPGDALFPVRVILDDERGEPVMMMMNYTSEMSDSRRFAVLFSLHDRRRDYPHISDEVWELIRKGQVQTGMTKDECRLALGNPSGVDGGHTHSSTVDIWQYPDGVFLRFTDGRLVSFRK